jgi:hypothetical protein
MTRPDLLAPMSSSSSSAAALAVALGAAAAAAVAVAVAVGEGCSLVASGAALVPHPDDMAALTISAPSTLTANVTDPIRIHVDAIVLHTTEGGVRSLPGRGAIRLTGLRDHASLPI